MLVRIAAVERLYRQSLFSLPRQPQVSIDFGVVVYRRFGPNFVTIPRPNELGPLLEDVGAPVCGGGGCGTTGRLATMAPLEPQSVAQLLQDSVQHASLRFFLAAHRPAPLG